MDGASVRSTATIIANCTNCDVSYTVAIQITKVGDGSTKEILIDKCRTVCCSIINLDS